MALHTAQTVPEIAVSRVRKDQDEIAGKRTREGKEEGGRSQKSGVQEFRSAGMREAYNIIFYCFLFCCNLLHMAKAAKTFKELPVWQKAHQFVLLVYPVTATFPASEIYCLSAQMRKAAISVAANIAEGFKKGGVSDKTRFLNTAQGSLEECRYYLILTQDLGYAQTSETENLLQEVFKLLVAYARAVVANRRRA
jgi:four helix bundle protein